VYASETPLEIGAHGHGAQAPFNGVVYAVQVLDSGLTIADPDFTEQPTGTGAFTDTVGNPWTVHGAAQIGPEDKFDIVAGGEVMRVEGITGAFRSEEHTSELQSRFDLVCRLLLEKKKKNQTHTYHIQKENNTKRS